jgi:hypothetical protein
MTIPNLFLLFAHCIPIHCPGSIRNGIPPAYVEDQPHVPWDNNASGSQKSMLDTQLSVQLCPQQWWAEGKSQREFLFVLISKQKVRKQVERCSPAQNWTGPFLFVYFKG